jgi:hypothetical protein
LRRPRSWTLQEPQTERREHQDNPDIYDQALPEVVPEEQDVHADHDGYQREHVKHDRCLSSHRFVLLGATEWSNNGRLRWCGVRDDDLPTPEVGDGSRAHGDAAELGGSPSQAAVKERTAKWSANETDGLDFAIETLGDPPVLGDNIGVVGRAPPGPVCGARDRRPLRYAWRPRPAAPSTASA